MVNLTTAKLVLINANFGQFQGKRLLWNILSPLRTSVFTYIFVFLCDKDSWEKFSCTYLVLEVWRSKFSILLSDSVQINESLMVSKNFDWIKHDQSVPNIVFAIPVNASFLAVNLPSFLAFTSPVKWSNVDFLSHLPFGAKYEVNNIFHHLCFKCNYCANITFASNIK